MDTEDDQSWVAQRAPLFKKMLVPTFVETRTMPPLPMKSEPPAKLIALVPLFVPWPSEILGVVAVPPLIKRIALPACELPIERPVVVSLMFKVPPSTSKSDQRLVLLSPTISAPPTLR